MKNTSKKQLYESIMRNVSRIVKLKLNEDLLSDLEDDDDDDSDFVNYDNNIVTLFKDKPDIVFMNTYNKIGDLLTYKNNLFFIIKNNKTIIKIRENLNTEYYGKVIGMCVGKGLWLSTEYDYTNKYQWSESRTSLFNDEIKTTNDDGWYNTTYIWNNYSDEISNTIWEVLYEQEITGLGEHICYLPTKNQLKKIYENNNIINLYCGEYWSSFQCLNYYNLAYIVTFDDGAVCYDSKISKNYSLALLHFE